MESCWRSGLLMQAHFRTSKKIVDKFLQAIRIYSAEFCSSVHDWSSAGCHSIIGDKAFKGSNTNHCWTKSRLISQWEAMVRSRWTLNQNSVLFWNPGIRYVCANWLWSLYDRLIGVKGSLQPTFLALLQVMCLRGTYYPSPPANLPKCCSSHLSQSRDKWIIQRSIPTQLCSSNVKKSTRDLQPVWAS